MEVYGKALFKVAEKSRNKFYSKTAAKVVLSSQFTVQIIQPDVP
jgi:hypothetical protein